MLDPVMSTNENQAHHCYDKLNFDVKLFNRTSFRCINANAFYSFNCHKLD